MPELPEVETIRKDLIKKIIGKKIIAIKVIQKKSIKNSPNKFIKALQNNYIINIKRKGKFLIFELNNKNYLLVHLRMTGQLIYKLDLSTYAQNALARFHFAKKVHNKHSRVILYFEDKSELYFNDTRRFGYLQISNKREKNEIMKKIGIDAINKKFNFRVLKILLKNKNRILKTILLDQKIIAGIGNIYTDEICFDAKLNPKRKANELDDKELKRLYNSIRKILALSIKHRGTTFSDYVDASGKKGNFAKFLKVYGREKENCKKCGKKSIQKTKLAGRTTRFCRNCQK
jgi:formamidopyrimidine-DNA glycosylase